MTTGIAGDAGAEWLIDAFGCDPARLASADALRQIFDRVIAELELKPVTPAAFHTFPGAGGVTGFVMLAESHLSCHTFPESGFAAFDLYCCRERPDWDWESALAKALGAVRVNVRRVSRGVAAS
jgi:S-adenosylmethionine decarboxylase